MPRNRTPLTFSPATAITCPSADAVAETDERAEVEYGPHAEYAFRKGLGSIPIEKLGLPGAGVHVFEATKQVYRAIPARREKRRLVPALEPALAPGG